MNATEKSTRNYITHTYEPGLTQEQKAKQRRDTRKALKASTQQVPATIVPVPSTESEVCTEPVQTDEQPVADSAPAEQPKSDRKKNRHNRHN